jgi:lia operon protein LiaF
MSKQYFKNYFWGALLILFGLLFLFDNLRIFDIDVILSNIWPLILILVGVYFILKSRSSDEKKENGPFGDKQYSSSANDIAESNTFGDIKISLDCDNFLGGYARTTFGDLKIDAEKLKIRDGEKRLNANTVFGDIKISIPKDMAIKVSASNLAGDINIFDQKRDGFNQKVSYEQPGYESAAQKLFIVCSVTFGDIKVW